MTKFIDNSIENLYKTTVNKIIKGWNSLVSYTKTIDVQLTLADSASLEKLMHECLNHKGGEVTARKKTIDLGYRYLELDKNSKKVFLKILATKFDVDQKLLTAKLTDLQQLTDKEQLIKIRYELKELLDSDRINILRQFNSLPQGIKFLVDMRADLLSFAKDKDLDLATLEKDLKILLQNWFDVGLLDIKEIDWNSSAALLEKLIAYEAVHAIKGWNDLKNRLDHDRKCYAFFHHKMPNEPLIFIEVALSPSVVHKIDELLDETAPLFNPREANCAIFYSISNTQHGLTGISFGNFLIKQVVEKLTHEFNNISKFITLSPLPNFSKWLDSLTNQELEKILSKSDMKLLIADQDKSSIKQILNQLLAFDWLKDENKKSILEQILPKLCANYLVNAKKDGKAYDPVAHFHLSNGAQIEHINFLADLSEKGLKQSFSMMVNYRYILEDIDENHENYNNNKIAISSYVKKLL